MFINAYAVLNTAFSLQGDEHLDHCVTLEIHVRSQDQRFTRLEIAMIQR